MGASDTLGFGADRPLVEGWPQVFRRDHLRADARFSVVGLPGATVASALTNQLPRALAEQPTLVTVWLAVNDLLAAVPPAAYEAQLRRLVHELRRGGTTTVLLANAPPHWVLPRSVGEDTVRSYNDVIARVARLEGAVLVDLHRAATEARARGEHRQLVGADGFHPSTAGHRAIAEAFAAAFRSTQELRAR